MNKNFVKLIFYLGSKVAEKKNLKKNEESEDACYELKLAQKKAGNALEVGLSIPNPLV